MQFLFYRSNGTYCTTNTNIRDILAEVQPDDIIDALDCVGIKVNRYFEKIQTIFCGYLIRLQKSKKYL